MQRARRRAFESALLLHSPMTARLAGREQPIQEVFAMRWKTNIAALALLAITATSCSTNPATGKKQIAFIGEEQEIAMGREADQQIVQQLGLYDDKDVQAYVSRLGKQLAASSERPN